MKGKCSSKDGVLWNLCSLESYNPDTLPNEVNVLNFQFLFKKYLDFENSNGDDERAKYVKTKAMEYVEAKLA